MNKFVIALLALLIGIGSAFANLALGWRAFADSDTAGDRQGQIDTTHAGLGAKGHEFGCGGLVDLGIELALGEFDDRTALSGFVR